MTHGDRIDQNQAEQSAEPSEDEQCDDEDDALARNRHADHHGRREHRRGNHDRSGSPKNLLATQIAVAAIAVATKTAAGMTSGRRRWTSASIATATGAPIASAARHCQARIEAGMPERPLPNSRATAAVHSDRLSAGAAKKLQPSPGNIHDT